ncbi:hypothetical protein SDC9_136828 [bioreactor metagenome]|uniref:Uncharacterized protein n=1 Tax=bioreactor metagenome TaxID=1076179 RepID=A0A645DK87_9ZZZZ
MPAGRISIVADINPGSVAFEQFGLLRCKGSAQAGHRVIHAVLIKARHIHIPLYHNQIAGAFPLLQIQSVEVIAFVEDGGIAGIEVLRRFVSHRPGPKAYHPAICSDNGENDAVPIGVVDPALFPPNSQTGL